VRDRVNGKWDESGAPIGPPRRAALDPECEGRLDVISMGMVAAAP
jgi:hypothetical protein